MTLQVQESVPRRPVVTFFALPWQDYMNLVNGVADASPPRWLALAVGAILGWWLYVPIHELLHAWGCLLGGGEVTRLEIDEWYGGTLLAQWIPWVSAGSDYAGQLVGFDTHGNDGTYLLTVLLPFVLSVFPAVWLLRRFAALPSVSGALFAGLSLGAVIAPFISIIGDLYETASILLSATLHSLGFIDDRDSLRSDDLLLLLEQLAERGAGFGEWLLVGAGTVLAIVLAFAIYALGAWVAGRLGARVPAQDHPGG